MQMSSGQNKLGSFAEGEEDHSGHSNGERDDTAGEVVRVRSDGALQVKVTGFYLNRKGEALNSEVTGSDLRLLKCLYSCVENRPRARTGAGRCAGRSDRALSKTR